MMAIQSSELKLLKSKIVNDTAANGGRMSTIEIADGVKNNIFPDVPQSERTAGSTKYRKTFWKVANDANLTLINPMVFVETYTPGDDRILLFPGTQNDTQNDIGTPRLYGSGQLDSDVVNGAGTIDVNMELAADAAIQDGDLVRVSNKANVDNVTGTVEFLRLANPGGVSWNGDKATLTFDTGVTLQNDYTAATTRVAACIEFTDIATAWDSWGGSTSAGTYDGNSPATPPTTVVPVLDNIGSIEQIWTITFTDATNFTCIGDVVGAVGGGSIGGGDFSPNNSDYSKPYFTLPDTGWGGTWATGETLTFTTHPAAAPVWWKRAVPAGADSLSGDTVVVALVGESA